ncbi:NAD(P)-binding protein [Cucurbitaria berberidis CBS 394.84]|uniref:NAD(P)-binding protein n=1 Tax=Cucurbitaria berberidis CBS 394.84 TaxID=1168544 RepID=A0A9P4LD37_9PLEO|nr:NAD(P)-binding protein [Cucurbitaria berberidis CBS 394.84]KAF1849982.1 NAD(P)-binding protein [Cucurbitaria berberidis CBS 394.84]
MMALFQPNASEFQTLKSTPKTIVITGGSSGIGLATAQLLSSLNPNHNLVLIDLQQPPSTFNHNPARLLVHTCNITSWADQRAGFEKAYARFGRIDCVFVNAGIAEHGEQFFNDELDIDGKLKEPDRRVLNIDMDAASDTTKLAIHYLKKNRQEGGQIVLTASLAGYLASAGAPLYSAAKHDQSTDHLITVTPILIGNNRRMNGAPAEVYAAEMAKIGVPINKSESIALAVCWLFNGGKSANGAGIFVQADRFVDLERGLAKTREQWMTKEMLDLFRGGRGAPLFARIEEGTKSKI